MENTNIEQFLPLIYPHHLKKEYPVSDETVKNIQSWRNEVANIISGKSQKKLFIVGPCSIHNVDQALEYAFKLKSIADKVKETIFVVMRVYFEKPRTTVGWKGLINDPYLNGTYEVNDGLRFARQLLLSINEIGLPCGYEVLDTITPQYISDLITWSAVGARTTESQVHRQLVSGLSMPVGFKNGTGGGKEIARDAVLSATYPHCFMGITDDGVPAICKTKGNKNCHAILRGGKDGPNYSRVDIVVMSNLLENKKLNSRIMIDCSHGNSCKDHTKQKSVLSNVIEGMKYNDTVFGVMLESNLKEGKQEMKNGIQGLKHGISVTDSCISIEETDKLLCESDRVLKTILGKRFQTISEC